LFEGIRWLRHVLLLLMPNEVKPSKRCSYRVVCGPLYKREHFLKFAGMRSLPMEIRCFL
jgi:hypothetical protein